ncbi:YcaO-like family protein [Stappia sp. F7233]|uniref:YcaO-like family protein n=1 Tax=Stappia albiluteola TaxID=2758565 RepID=A0A839AHD5_9HYPH|nr:YcaO-like family protein [Stappia albiluteola]MBA5779113.1 YcaO-like family protein [Stappia albiluteola]
MRQALVAAAELYSNAAGTPSTGAQGFALLDWLGLSDLSDAADREDLARLLRFAAKLDHLFELRSPTAPGLCCFGAVASTSEYGAVVSATASVSGVGQDRATAFRACVAEAAEFVCQFESGEETRASSPGIRREGPDGSWHAATEAYAWNGLTGGRELDASDWVWAERVTDGRWCRLPGILTFRRGRGRDANGLSYAMGVGVAAGRNAQEAACHAILEWVERDAVALWWRGGRSPAAVPMEIFDGTGLAGRLGQYRDGLVERRTWFLDLTTDLDIPVAAALSVGRDGQGFAYGFAAATNLADACRNALDELLQIELADHLVAAKQRERGNEGLNETDRKHLERFSKIGSDWPGLQAAKMGTAECRRNEDSRDAKEVLAYLAQRLEAHGHPVHLVDLTREDIAVPVIRAIVDGLQPDPSELVLPRLETQRQASGLARIPGDAIALY